VNLPAEKGGFVETDRKFARSAFKLAKKDEVNLALASCVFDQK
jgi:hypothetical protein